MNELLGCHVSLRDALDEGMLISRLQDLLGLLHSIDSLNVIFAISSPYFHRGYFYRRYEKSRSLWSDFGSEQMEVRP